MRSTVRGYSGAADRAGLFYRYIPDVPGKLAQGGKLQALAFRHAHG